MEYESVIGLEVHVQLATETKLFCNCSTKFGAEPNTHICPVCAGLPGVLPVLNEKVVEYAIKAALAINCEVASYTKFDRKNYFYPDLPKAYQTSQFDLPIGEHGSLMITDENGQDKKIGITRIHMEEDAGKLIHSSDDFTAAKFSYADFNRTGVPLLEIVSEPDLRTPQEAHQYLNKLKSIMRYIEVSDCNMEEGSLRCDANVSIREKGAEKLGTKVELKNMNSFKNVEKALEYEIKRLTAMVKNNEKISQETRLWDANTGRTSAMRSKEESHDYRYFPEPDLVPIRISDEWKNRVKKTIPELPDKKIERFITEYALPPYDAAVLSAEKDIADFFEKIAKVVSEPKIASNWVMGEVLRRLNENQISITQFPVSAKDLADLIKVIENGTISNNIAKTVFDEMIKTGNKAKEIIDSKGLKQISDSSEIEKIIDGILDANTEQVQKYKEGKTQLFGFFMGQLMKATRGKADPKLSSKILKDKLNA